MTILTAFGPSHWEGFCERGEGSTLEPALLSCMHRAHDTVPHPTTAVYRGTCGSRAGRIPTSVLDSGLIPGLEAAALTLTVHLWGTVWEWVLFAGVSRHTLPVHMWPGEIVQPGREVQPSVPFCSYSGRPGHCRVVRRIPEHHSVSPGLEPLLSHAWWCLV